MLIESWLTSDITDSELELEEYDIFRCDRSLLTSNKSRGGGVLIASCKKLKINFFNIHTDVEQLFVSFKYGREKYIIGAVYIPPNSPQEVYNRHCDTIENIIQANPDQKVCIFGDYNIPNAYWRLVDGVMQLECPHNSPAVIISDCFTYLSMNQIVNIPNNRGVFLDLVFTNITSVSISPSSDLLMPNSMHHIAYCVSFCVCNYKMDHINYTEFYYDFGNANYVALNDYLASVNWLELLKNLDMENATRSFYDALYLGIAYYVPLKKFKTNNFPKWFSTELRRLVTQKKIAHINYLTTKSAENYLVFSELRATCKQVSKEDYNNYVKNVNEQLLTDPKKFWQYINNKKSSYKLPGSMHLDDETASNGETIVNLFAKYFSTVYSKSQVHTLTEDYCEPLNISISKFTLFEVFSKIEKLPNKLSTGPDGIPNILLKNCIYTITTPLMLLFNLSLDQKTLPDMWKTSFIVPIYKSGDKENIKNYRGVCNQSSIPKLLDSLVYDDLSWSCKSIIIDQQHGFLSGKSTSSNLLIYTTDIFNALECKCQVDSIYTDFAKAFDRVDHSLLINKLKIVGFSDGLLSWLKSFLSNRKQKVKIGSYTSSEINVSSGVPQGTHCAPLLFSLFVNDIGKYIKNCSFLMFADDLKLYRKISSPEDIIMLQNDVNNLYQWSVDNNLALNIDKCSCISFSKNLQTQNIYTLNTVPLKYVTSIKDLGVIFDEKVTFREHIDSVSIKTSKLLGFVLRNCSLLSSFSILNIYKSLVRPNIEYASIIWSPLYQIHIQRLERVQNKFLRYYAYKNNTQILDHDYSQLLSEMKLDTLENRRRVFDICFVYKLLNGMINCPELLKLIKINVPSIPLRNNRTFCVGYHSTNYGQHSPVDRAMNSINELNIDVFTNSIASFKCRIIL